MSREILQQTLSAETQIALQNFKKEVEKGNPIFPYMSKSIEKSAFFDGLLFDWGFHHFHMGIGKDNDDPRFIKRNNFLLIARIQSDQIYFIKIVPHKNVEWYKDELVRIFADNWPDVAEAGRMKFADGLTEKIDGKLRKKLRDDIHANSPVDLNDGRVYVGPNLGLTSAGTPVIATLWAQKAYNNAAIMQKLMEEKEASIIEAIRQKVYKEDFELRLIEPGMNDYTFQVVGLPVILRLRLCGTNLQIIVGDSQKQIKERINC